MDRELTVRCACGETELVIKGPQVAHLFCHCDDCQLLHGGAYSPEAVYPASSVEVTRGTPAVWTYKRNPRARCSTCGARLFIDVLGRQLRGVNGMLLKEAFRPSFHMQCQFAVAPVVDDLPHYAGIAPMFGGPQKMMEW